MTSSLKSLANQSKILLTHRVSPSRRLNRGSLINARCRLVQLLVQTVSGKRFALKRGAAFGCTVDGKMDPRILEPFSQDIVFNLIQGQQAAVDAGDLFLPGGFKKAPQFLDGLYFRVAGQNQFDGPCIVGVGIKSELPVCREGFRVDGGEHIQVLIEKGFVILDAAGNPRDRLLRAGSTGRRKARDPPMRHKRRGAG
jgi:hypothetical protein